MLTCREFDKFMVALLENDLPLTQKLVCWLHVSMCKECRNYVRQYQQTISLGKKAFEMADEPVPESVPDELIRAALARCKNARSK